MDLRFFSIVCLGLGGVCLLLGLGTVHMPLILLSIPLLIAGGVAKLRERSISKNK